MVLKEGPSIKAIIDFCYKSDYTGLSEYIKNKDADLAFDELITDIYFNHILHNSGDVKDVLEKYSPAFLKRNRLPAVYITPLSDSYGAESELDGLKKVSTDVWMILTKEDYKSINLINKNIDVSIIDAEHKDEYLNVFKKAFSNAGDVYGDLAEGYSIGEEKSFSDNNGFDINAFIAQENNRAIGIIRTLTKDSLCLICAFGIEKQYRKGVSAVRALGKASIEHAFNSGVETIFLKTESGTSLEKLYSRIGFKGVFTGTYYVSPESLEKI